MRGRASIDGSRPAPRALAARAPFRRSWRRRRAGGGRHRAVTVAAVFLRGGEIRLNHARGAVAPEDSRGWRAADEERLVVLTHHYPLDAGPTVALQPLAQRRIVALAGGLDRWRVVVPMEIGAEHRERFWSAANGRRLPCSAATSTVRASTTAAAWPCAERTERRGVGGADHRVLPDRGTISSPPSSGSCRRISQRRDQNRYDEPPKDDGSARRRPRGRTLLARLQAALDAQAEPLSPIRASTSTRRARGIPARSRPADCLRGAPADSRRRPTRTGWRGPRRTNDAQVQDQRPFEQVVRGCFLGCHVGRRFGIPREAHRQPGRA